MFFICHFWYFDPTRFRIIFSIFRTSFMIMVYDTPDRLQMLGLIRRYGRSVYALYRGRLSESGSVITDIVQFVVDAVLFCVRSFTDVDCQLVASRKNIDSEFRHAAGNVMSVMDEQLQNALLAIRDVPSGIIREVSPEQPMNTDWPIEVRPAGRLSSVRPVQYMKA